MIIALSIPPTVNHYFVFVLSNWEQLVSFDAQLKGLE